MHLKQVAQSIVSRFHSQTNYNPLILRIFRDCNGTWHVITIVPVKHYDVMKGLLFEQFPHGTCWKTDIRTSSVSVNPFTEVHLESPNPPSSLDDQHLIEIDNAISKLVLCYKKMEATKIKMLAARIAQKGVSTQYKISVQFKKDM